MENGRIFQQLILEIVEIYGDLLVSVILYGSVANSIKEKCYGLIRKNARR